jgi:tetratricopeptide (TPR) repeat protein
MLRLLVPPGRAAVFLALLVTLCAHSAQAAEPQWQEIRSPNFVVITDAGQKRGMEIALRFEQMRSVFGQLLSRKRVNMPVPLTIYALGDDQRYYAIAPLVDGRPIDAAGFYVPGEDHQFIVLNSTGPEPWRAIAHSFAHLLLNYNYPPTQSWFDEGFAEYFASIRPDDKQVEIGGDPGAPNSQAGKSPGAKNPEKPLTEVLNSPTWLSLRALLSTRQDSASEKGVPQPTLFEAQSWITMHYLLANNKLSETGTYFELVENRNVPPEDSIQQAYGMSAEEFDRAVKDYFRSRMQTGQPAGGPSAANGNQPLAQRMPAPMGPDDIRITSKPVSEADARAQLAEVMLRLPARREQGLQELKSVLELKDKHDQPLDNEIAHRALAWAHMERKEYDKAAEELGTAAALNPQDVWIRYYLSLLKYKAARANRSEIQGLANMMQDLKATVDWYPDFAEAYYMLAVARLEGGGTGAALEAIYAAIGVSPRNEQYLLTLGQIQQTAKKWDAAHAIFERLASSHNPEIAAAAQKQLDEFANYRKYGMAGQGLARAPQASPFDELEQEAQKRAQEQPETGPDKRPTKFMKGRLVGVDCSQAPAAVLTVASGARSFKLRTPDYKSLLVIGADEFSCAWTDRTVSVNYKPGGTADGDVVSVELQ